MSAATQAGANGPGLQENPKQPGDAFRRRLESLDAETVARVRTAFAARIRREHAIDLDACLHCGLCTASCHYALVDEDVRNSPAYKVHLIAEPFNHETSWFRRLFPNWTGAHALDAHRVREWVDVLFGRCTMCGRCTANCVVGIDVPALVRAARGALADAGLVPAELQGTVDTAVASGNNMGIPQDEWVATIEWLEDELRAEVNDPTARLPLDEPDADFLYVLNPREPKFFPLSIVAAAAIFHEAGVRWTLARDYFDVTNYAMFSGDVNAARTISKRLVDTTRRLRARSLVLGECGHGFNANRWLAPEWLGEAPGFPVRSVLEVVSEFIRDGRIRLDPAKVPELVTLHDPCNLVRGGGVIEPQRAILGRAVERWVEMTPNRTQNYCCGGGGGQLSMTRFARRRLAAGRVKADQIRATGARVVAAPCHNCIDQLTELNKEYKLGVEVKTVCEIVASALVHPS
jgi:Fe-S oxidoreductase